MHACILVWVGAGIACPSFFFVPVPNRKIGRRTHHHTLLARYTHRADEDEEEDTHFDDHHVLVLNLEATSVEALPELETAEIQVRVGGLGVKWSGFWGLWGGWNGVFVGGRKCMHARFGCSTTYPHSI